MTFDGISSIKRIFATEPKKVTAQLEKAAAKPENLPHLWKFILSFCESEPFLKNHYSSAKTKRRYPYYPQQNFFPRNPIIELFHKKGCNF